MPAPVIPGWRIRRLLLLGDRTVLVWVASFAVYEGCRALRAGSSAENRALGEREGTLNAWPPFLRADLAARARGVSLRAGSEVRGMR